MDQMVKDMANFDFEAVEKNLVKEKLKELKAQDASKEIITNTMKDFGIERFLTKHPLTKPSYYTLERDLHNLVHILISIISTI